MRRSRVVAVPQMQTVMVFLLAFAEREAVKYDGGRDAVRV
jgi:hypothetical protein